MMAVPKQGSNGAADRGETLQRNIVNVLKGLTSKKGLVSMHHTEKV